MEFQTTKSHYWGAGSVLLKSKQRRGREHLDPREDIAISRWYAGSVRRTGDESEPGRRESVFLSLAIQKCHVRT